MKQLVKKFWKYPFLSFFLLILCLSIIPIVRSYYNFHINLVVSLIAFMLFTYNILRQTSNNTEFRLKIFLICIPFLAIVILSFFLPLKDYLPGLLFAPVLGIVLGIFLTSHNMYVKVAVALLPLFIGIWIFTSFSKMWQHFMIYNTFRSGETYKEMPSFTFFRNSKPITNDYFKDDTTVFFIWNTSCPYSSRYFSSLREKINIYSNNKNIKFYSVNIPTERDTIGADSTYIAKYNINIEKLIGPSPMEMYKIFGAMPVPLTIVLNFEGKMIYWGSIEKVDRTLQK